MNQRCVAVYNDAFACRPTHIQTLLFLTTEHHRENLHLSLFMVNGGPTTTASVVPYSQCDRN